MPRAWLEMAALLMFLRLYLLLRAARDFSAAFMQRELLRQEGSLPAVSWRLAIKAIYAEHPGESGTVTAL